CFLEAPKPASSGCSSAGGPLPALLLLALFLRPARLLLLALLAGGHSTSTSSPADAGQAGTPPPVQGLPVRACDPTLPFPPARTAARVSVAGEWNAFSPTANPMTDPLGTGTFRATLQLPPGDYAYKLVADGQYALDPQNPLSKWVGGVENSRLVVEDCAL